MLNEVNIMHFSVSKFGYKKNVCYLCNVIKKTITITTKNMTSIEDITANGGLEYNEKGDAKMTSTNLDSAANRSRISNEFLDENWGDDYAAWKENCDDLWFDIMSDKNGIFAVAGDKTGIVYFVKIGLLVSSNNQYFGLSLSAGDIAIDKEGDVAHFGYTPDLNKVVTDYASKLLDDEQLKLVEELEDFASQVRSGLDTYAQSFNGSDVWLYEIENGLECQGLPKLGVANDYRHIDRVDELTLYNEEADVNAIKEKILEVLKYIDFYLGDIKRHYINL